MPRECRPLFVSNPQPPELVQPSDINLPATRQPFQQREVDQFPTIGCGQLNGERAHAAPFMFMLFFSSSSSTVSSVPIRQVNGPKLPNPLASKFLHPAVQFERLPFRGRNQSGHD
jgi:hypothetical protein